MCGINRLFPTISCPIWNSCSDEVSVIVWEDAARSGRKTQLEQVEKQMKVSEAFEKLRDLIKDGRSGFVRGEWSNWQRKLDVKESNKNTRVILTDFSASLDLRARMTDNCSVDNHAVLDIFFCLSNFRQVQLQNGKIHDVCDTNVYCFFRSSMSSGKKNDHIFHIACLDYIMKLNDEQRRQNESDAIKITIV